MEEARVEREVHNRDMANLNYAQSVFIARSPEDLYDMISDITRMGEWSPVCQACWWEEGAGREVGAWFTGRNELPGRVWETKSQVAVADRGCEFAVIVGGDRVRWGYEFVLVPGGTGDGIVGVSARWSEFFEQMFGEDAPAQIVERTESARTGIPATLAAIKAAEAE